MEMSDRMYWNLKEIEIPNRGKMHFHVPGMPSAWHSRLPGGGLSPEETRKSNPGTCGD